MPARSLAIARHELLLLARDPLPLVLLLLVPLVFVAFLKPAAFLALVVDGYPGTNGAEQSVPGAATTFALFATGLVGLSFVREHGWGTWPRLRAVAGPGEIITGKLVPLTGFVLAQLGFLFVVGVLLFELRIRGPSAALALFFVPVALCDVALGIALAALCRTAAQVSALTNLTAAVLAGIGGALMPVRVLPEWAAAVAPISPAYWAMVGFRAVILDGAGLEALVRPGAILLGFAAAFAGLALVLGRRQSRIS